MINCLARNPSTFQRRPFSLVIFYFVFDHLKSKVTHLIVDIWSVESNVNGESWIVAVRCKAILIIRSVSNDKIRHSISLSAIINDGKCSCLEKLSICLNIAFHHTYISLGAIHLWRPQKITFLTSPVHMHPHGPDPLPPCGRPHTVDMKYTPLSWNG